MKEEKENVLDRVVPFLMVLGMLGFAVVAAVTLMFEERAYTPTQAALWGWCFWILPLGAIVLGGVSGGGGKVTLKALLAGVCIEGAIVIGAEVLYPGYPAGGPHEMWAFGVFVATAVSSIVVGVAWLRRRGTDAFACVAAAVPIALAAALGTWLSFDLCTNPLAWELPPSAYPIQRVVYDEFWDEAAYVRAPLGRDQVQAYVRRLHLESWPADRPAFDSPEMHRAPTWYRVPGRAQVWFDPRLGEPTKGLDRCWTIVRWDGRTVFASSGCEGS